MKKGVIVFVHIACLISLVIDGVCQTSVKYWIGFSDKFNSAFSVSDPEMFLSARSIERRNKQGIAITEVDLPVNQRYIDSLKHMGFNIINTSKWINGCIVEVNDSTLLESLKNISFINLPVIKLTSELPDSLLPDKAQSGAQNSLLEPDYGFSENHIRMLNGQHLHDKGYTGAGMLIAVLDVGFLNTNSLSSLQHLWNDNRIVATSDFVKDSMSFYQNYSHGTHVLGAMAGYLSQVVYGTAIEASFALLRTEAGAYEYLVEEYNWLCGAEFADSIGADIINSSLGYSAFWDPLQDHTYSDMNGNTTPVSIAATMAAERGILVVSSAGNEGDDSWHYISAPPDAEGILSVGAVDPYEFIAGFSSRGPTSDGRVKPDVCAQGIGVPVQSVGGDIAQFSGTSAASPIIAGLSACLWQANPLATSRQVIQSIVKSSSGYRNPDDEYGYGIPDFGKADMIVKQMINAGKNQLVSFNLFPNPAFDNINLEVYCHEGQIGNKITIGIIDVMGRVVKTEVNTITDIYTTFELNGLYLFPPGMYIVQVGFSEQVYYLLFLKNG